MNNWALFDGHIPNIDTASNFIVLWMCGLNDIMSIACGWRGSSGCCLNCTWTTLSRFQCGCWIRMSILCLRYCWNNWSTWNQNIVYCWHQFFFRCIWNIQRKAENVLLIQNVPRIIQAMLKWNFLRTFIFSCCDRCGCISRWCARWFSWCGADCRLLCCNWHSRVCFKETIKQKMLKKSPRNKLYLEAQEIFLLLPRIHGDSGALHCPVDKHVMNLGPSGLYPGAQTTSALAPYSVVPLIWTILAFSCTSGNSSHSIGSHLGGGPFHRSSMSHVSIARPIIS